MKRKRTDDESEINIANYAGTKGMKNKKKETRNGQHHKDREKKGDKKQTS